MSSALSPTVSAATALALLEATIDLPTEQLILYTDETLNTTKRLVPILNVECPFYTKSC